MTDSRRDLALIEKGAVEFQSLVVDAQKVG